ncbi:MAG: ribbon-helix-helix domain-containing protein [Fimbriimonadales bacterium]|nr:ribbon-helix-helix domain-containing protein [Fimbriimonadales bacterium]
MPAITIHVDEKTAERLRAAARRTRMPLSRYIAQKLQRQMEWAELVQSLSGAFPDFPEPKVLRLRTCRGKLSVR